jgi:polyphosphate glucokinase
VTDTSTGPTQSGAASTSSGPISPAPTSTAPTDAPAAEGHEHPYTLAFDIGGTGLKANVLDANGELVADRVRVPTTYPMPPKLLVEKLTGLAQKLPEADRISAGFPGMIRRGHVLTAPHFVTKKGPGTEIDLKLEEAWHHFHLAHELKKAIGKPCRVANDADVQGAAVVTGKGFEAVITLGTGFGTGFFMDGRLLPHFEFSHVQFRKGETFNEQLGEPARKKMGDKSWNKHVQKAIAYLDELTAFDHLFIGGGNAPRINRRDLGDVLKRITVVPNSAGILGGIKLWELDHVGLRSPDESQ